MKKLYVKKLKLDIKYDVDTITTTLFTLGSDSWNSHVNICTYDNPECNDKGDIVYRPTHRSVEDLLSVYNTYRPHTTLAEMLKSMEKYFLIDKKAYFIYCPDISKWVLQHGRWGDTNSPDYIYMVNYRGSNFKYDDRGSGEYSFREILNYMGISKEDRKYIVDKSNKVEDADNRFPVSV